MTSSAVALLALVAAVTPDEAALLTSIVATAAEAQPNVDVLTSEDVRKAIQVEAEKQVIGCDEEASCLAEIAGAMGARAIIYGSVGALGDLQLVTLNLYDTALGKSGGRAVVRGASLEALSQSLETAVTSIVTKWEREPGDGEASLRLLVMDLEVKGGAGAVASSEPATEPVPAPATESVPAPATEPVPAPATEPVPAPATEPVPAPASEPASTGLSPWTWSAVGASVIGLGGLSAGIAFDMLALDLNMKTTGNQTLFAAEAQKAYDERDLYRGLSVAGVLGGASFLLVGAGLWMVGSME